MSPKIDVTIVGMWGNAPKPPCVLGYDIRVYVSIVLVGMYGNAPKPPCVLGYEGSGVVSQLGEGVDDFKVKFVSKYFTNVTGYI